MKNQKNLLEDVPMIILYSDTHCNRCRGVEVYLNSKGIEFEKVLISDLPDVEFKNVVELAKSANSLALPILVQDGKVINVGDL